MRSLFTNISFVYTLLLISSSLQGQLGLKWVQSPTDVSIAAPRMDGSGRDEILSVSVGSSDDIYSVGSYFSLGGTMIALFKHSASGNLLWKTQIQGMQISEDGINLNIGTLDNAVVRVGSSGVYVYCNIINTSIEEDVCGFGGWNFYRYLNQIRASSVSGRVDSTVRLPPFSQQGKVYVGALLKYSFDGELLWMTPTELKFPCNSGGCYVYEYAAVRVTDIALDALDNAYLAMNYIGSSDNCYGNINSSPTLSFCQDASCNIGHDMVSCGGRNWGNRSGVIAYDTDGSYLWGRSMTATRSSGTNNSDEQVSIYRLQISGNSLYLSGDFTGWLYEATAVSGTSTNCSNALTSTALRLVSANSGRDGFISRWQLNGTNTSSTWYKRIGGRATETVTDFRVFNGKVFVVVNVPSTSSSSPFTLRYGAGNTATDTSNYETFRGYFLASFNDEGTNLVPHIEWAQAISMTNGNFPFVFSTTNRESISLNINPANSKLAFLINARFTNNTVSYNSLPLTPTNRTLPGTPTFGTESCLDDYLIQEYSLSSGNLGQTIQVSKIGSTSREAVNQMIISAGDYIVAGGYRGVGTFSALGVGVASNLSSTNNSDDGFIARYGCWKIQAVSPDTTFCVGTPIRLRVNTDCTGACDYEYTYTNVLNSSTIVSGIDSVSFNGQIGANLFIVSGVERVTGCEDSDTLSLTMSPNISSINVTPSSAIDCPNTLKTFTVSANPSGASYTWYRNGQVVGTGSSFSTSQAGSYDVEASINGCKANSAVVYNQYPLLSPRVIPDNPQLCGNSGVLVQVLDCPGCDYVWTVPIGSSTASSDRTILADAQGLYQVQIRDANNCQYSRSTNVSVGSFLTPPIFSRNISNSPPSDVICDNQPLIIESTDFQTCPTCLYEWSDGATGPYTFAFGPGNFRVTVTDLLSGCVGVSPDLAIAQSWIPSPSVSVTVPTVCDYYGSTASLPAVPAELEVMSPCTNCTYEWMANNGVGTVLGTGTSFEVTAAGDYYVVLTDTLGCRSTSAVHEISAVSITPPYIHMTHNSFCAGGGVNLSIQNCQGCSYQWYYKANSGATEQPLFAASSSNYYAQTSGEYNVEVSYSNGCTVWADTWVSVTETSGTLTIGSERYRNILAGNPSAVLPSIVYICNNTPDYLVVDNLLDANSNSITVLRPPTWTFQWFFNGSPIPGAVGHRLLVSTPGIYALLITTEDGCPLYSNNITVQGSNAGANPSLNLSPETRCRINATTTTSTTLTTTACPTCSYRWFTPTSTGIVENSSIVTSTYTTSSAGVYYVIIRENTSFCEYATNIVEFRDTVYPAPVLASSSANICSASPVISSATPCTGCDYDWYRTVGGVRTLVLSSSPQNTYTVPLGASGEYEVVAIQPNGCPSRPSNILPVSFSIGSVNISTPQNSTICNGSQVVIEAIPNLVGCPNCLYTWYRDGVLTNVVNSPTDDNFTVTVPGDYSVVVRDVLSQCQDTSAVVSVGAFSANIDLQRSARAVCGLTNSVTLTASGNCLGCTYEWTFGVDPNAPASSVGLPLSGVTGTSHTISGNSSAGLYRVVATSAGGGCAVWDTISVDTASPLTFVTNALPYSDICGNTPIVLSVLNDATSCVGCLSTGYTWFRDGQVISGAQTSSLVVDIPGDYSVSVVNADGCIASSPLIPVAQIQTGPGFLLNFDSISPIPTSYGPVDVMLYLNPVSRRTDTTGRFTSLTASSALSGALFNNIFDPVIAGPGPHIIRYTYQESNCSFFTEDTLEVLQPLSVSISNRNLAAPPFEACINDTLVLDLVNFTFPPNRVLFSTGAAGLVAVTPTSSSLTPFSGVWSGALRVPVPVGARTGRLWLVNGTDSLQTTFFVSVQNPAVGMSLAGATPSFLCNTADTVRLVGTPQGGFFNVAAFPDTTTFIPSWLTTVVDTNWLQLGAIPTAAYTNGQLNLQVRYTYTPRYTDGTLCPATAPLSLARYNVQVRDVRIDSIDYTPLSITQASETMPNLTRMIYPAQARVYAGAYSGTYVSNNAILPSTLDTVVPNAFNQAVRYTISNGGCSNSVEDTVRLWRAPAIFDFLPADICQSGDTIYFGRDNLGLYLEIRDLSGVYNTFRADAQYARQSNQVSGGLDFYYTEEINLMSLSPLGTGTGITQLVTIPGQERYAIVPNQVPGSTLNLNLQFEYERETEYFSVNPGIQLTRYTIAQVSKTVNFEQPFTAQINPATVANPVFCPINQNIQLAGIPAGGEFRLSIANLNAFATVSNGILNPATQGSGDYDLRYVVISRACSDSTVLRITIPNTFSVTNILGMVNTTGAYCERDNPDEITGLISPASTPIDSASIIFTVNGLQAGRFFNPTSARVSTSHLITDTVNVGYSVADTFGCRQSFSRQFLVHATPQVSMVMDSTITPLNAANTTLRYCLNAAARPMTLLFGTNNTTNQRFSIASTRTAVLGAVQNATTLPTGLLYSPATAGVGTDLVTYAYVDGNGCTDTIRQSVTILALPVLDIQTATGPLAASYCESEVIPLVGVPFNSTSRFGSLGTTNPNGSNLDSAAMGVNANFFRPLITPSLPTTALETIFYRYQDLNTGCADTITRQIEIRNRADIVDWGTATSVSPICANRVDVPMVITSSGVGITSGTFSLVARTTVPPITVIPNADQFSLRQTGVQQANFRPDSINARTFPADVTFRYDYISNGCAHFATHVVRVNPLPDLVFQNPGDSLPNSPDRRMHICIFRDSTPMVFRDRSQNSAILPQTSASYLGWTSDPAINSIYNRGVVLRTTNSTFYYVTSEMARRVSTFGGAVADTVVFAYQNPVTGCRDTLRELVVLDTIPALGFAGIDPARFDSTLGRYVFCQNDPPVLIVPSPFGGSLRFNTQPISAGVFTFDPPTLAMPPSGYRQDSMHYVFTTQRYVNHPACADSVSLALETRPIPVLQFVSVPTEYCVRDSQTRIPLQALPVGGRFVDATQPVVLGGIVADTLFNPVAQAGRRLVAYSYTEPSTGCSNIITRAINVYRAPNPNFTIGGGCAGAPVTFIPGPTGLSNVPPSIDSVTMLIWNYGDGQIDTLYNVVNPASLTQVQHTYAQTGIYFPSLTIINRGQCDTMAMNRIVVSPVEVPLAGAPYTQDFEAGPGDWFQEDVSPSALSPSDTLWQWGMAAGRRISTVATQDHVWATRLNDAYTPDRQAWVYSPCFDLRALEQPMIKFDVWRDARNGVDGAVIEYYDDVQQGWRVLGQRQRGENWYGQPYVISRPGAQASSLNPPIGWTGSNQEWETARYRLDVSGDDLRGRDQVRFRIAFASSNNTIVNGLEGFAFDDVYVGNRRRGVLLEHFSNQATSGMAAIENNLYGAIYSNVYGRDVHLLQYQTPFGGADVLYDESQPEVNSRTFIYGISSPNTMRLNGAVTSNGSFTSSFVANQLQSLDVEMLQDPTFDIRLFPLSVRNGRLVISGVLTAVDTLADSDYALYVMVTEDSILSRQRHRMMSVLRKSLPGSDGRNFSRSWVPGDAELINGEWQVPSYVRPEGLEVVVFVQDLKDPDKKVHQVATTRDLTIYQGPVSVEELKPEEGAEIVNLTLFPNPTTERFFVRFDSPLEGNYQWRLFDIQGRVLRQGQTAQGLDLLEVETSDLSGGMYIFAIENENVYTQRKVIIRR